MLTALSRTLRPPAGAARLWSTRVHRWTGFALLVWFVFEAVSGSYLAVGRDIDRWREGDRYAHTAGDVGPSAAVTRAQAGVPGGRAETIVYPYDEHGVYVVHVLDEAGDERQVYVDPGTGRINASVAEGETFYTLVYQLHADFNTAEILGVPSRTIVGWLGILWLANLILGFAILRRRRRALTPSWVMRRGRPRRGFHLVIHNAVGLIILVPAIVAVATGIAIEFPNQTDAAVSAVAPGDLAAGGGVVVPSSTPSATGERTTLDALTGAVAGAGLGPIRWVTVPLGNPAGVFTAYVDGGGYSSLEGPFTGRGRTLTVWIDQYRPVVLGVSDPAARSAARQIRNDWIYGLHFGAFLSWLSRAIWVLLGAGTVALAVTALYMRSGRWPWRRRRTPLPPSLQDAEEDDPVPTPTERTPL